MTIAKRLKAHLEAEGVTYETIDHPRTATASETAQAAHVPGTRLAKTVVLHLESWSRARRGAEQSPARPQRVAEPT